MNRSTRVINNHSESDIGRLYTSRKKHTISAKSLGTLEALLRPFV